MYSILLRELLAPLVRRVAGYSGAFLTSAGLSSADTSQLVAAIPIAAGIAIDLTLSTLSRKK